MWCRFTNVSPKKYRVAPLPKFGAQKKSNFRPLFPRLPHSTPHISGTKRHIDTTNKNANVNLQCIPYKLIYFPWPLTQKRLRSVCLLWHDIRRPFRCNHQSCDISSLSVFCVGFYWKCSVHVGCTGERRQTWMPIRVSRSHVEFVHGLSTV